MAKQCVISRGARKGKLKKGWRFGKNGNCVKKRRKKRCKRTHRKVEGVDVALPCGSKSLSTGMMAKLDNTFTQREWSDCAKGQKKGCRVIFFTSKAPVMRHPGRKLTTAARKRPMPCANKNGKFVKCTGGRKRLRRKAKR